MRFEHVEVGNKHYDKVNKLIHNAFPPEELLPMEILNERAQLDNFYFLAIYDNDLFVGMTYVMTNDTDSICYIFFLAIDEQLRGQGYGSKVLENIKTKYNFVKSLILLIEEVDEKYDNYKQRASRLNFYERNGFKLQGIKTNEQDVVFDVLAYGDDINMASYEATSKLFFGSEYYHEYQGPIYLV